MSRSLAVQTVAYSAATLLSRGIAVVFLIVLPGFVSVEDYGVLGLTATVIALANVIVPLEVSQGLIRFYPGAEASAKLPLVNSAWGFTLVMIVAVAVVALWFAAPLNAALFGQAQFLAAFRIMVVLTAATILFTFVQNQFRWDFRTADFVVVSLSFTIVTLVLSLLFAALFADPLVGVLTGQLAGTLIALALGAYRQRANLYPRISRPALRRMLRFSFPLVPASLALFVSSYASRLILQAMASLGEVGVFTWASQLASIPALLLLGFQSSVTPYVMKHHGDPGCPALLARMLEALVAIELCLCVGLGLIAPTLIAASGYTQFTAAGPLVMILAPAAMMLQLYVFAPGFAIGERTKLQLGVSLASALVGVAANFLLISRFGTVGAAWAFFLSSATFFGAWLALSQRLYSLPLREGRLLILILASAAIALAGAQIEGWLIVKLGLVTLLAILAFSLRLLDLRWLAVLRSGTKAR
jgi:O-antigen/teichoic acid export membrane protein